MPVLGDVLLGTPLLRALHRHFPESEIDVLVRRSCATALEGNPDVSRIIESTKHPSFREYTDLVWRLLRRYDLAVSNALSDRAAIYAFIAARKRVTWVDPGSQGFGWKRRAFQRWSTDPLNTPSCHPLQMNQRIARLLELPYDGQLVLPAAADCESRVHKLLGTPDHRRLAILHPTASAPYKHWHRKGWLELACGLRERGYRLVVTGGPGAAERAYLDELFAGTPDTVIAAGHLRLGDLRALFARAHAFVGVDTSITHMAAGSGLPTVVLFGPEDPRVWAPWPRSNDPWQYPDYPQRGDSRAGNVMLLHSSLPCVPCRKKGCDNRDNSRTECLDEIQANRVLGAIDSLMARK